MKLTRGQSVIFSKNLKNSSGVEPDLTGAVTARIMDPSQNIVSQGPAYRNLDSNLYEYSYTVGSEAPYSTIDQSWTLDWTFQLNSQTINLITEFDVVEDSDDLPPRSLILSSKSKEDIEFVLPDKAKSLVFEILDYRDVVVFTTSNIEEFDTLATTKGYIYCLAYDTTNLACGDYMIRVHAKIPNRRSTYTEIIIARVVPNYFWFYVPQLQSYLDKVRKPGNLVQSYGIADLYEYLTKGMSMLNLVPPQVTTWSLFDYPGGHSGSIDISAYLVQAAACWGLQSQILMYGELGFHSNGQTVSIDYDPSAAIGGTIETCLNRINVEFPKVKHLILRQTQKTAWVGVRRQFYNQNLSRIDILNRAFNLQLNLLNSKMAYRYLV